MTIKTLVDRQTGVANVILSRPDKLNAMNTAFWSDCKHIFSTLSTDPDVRVILLSAQGRAFTAGLDLKDGPLNTLFADPDPSPDEARSSIKILDTLRYLQSCFTAIASCRQPVIACIHGPCVGGGIDMITACDIRLCTSDAQFCVKEVDIAIAADVGTLQRLAWVNDVCLTGRVFSGQEAERVGLVSQTFPSSQEMMDAAQRLALQIASKSPVATYGIKHILDYSRERSVSEGLEHVALWNASMFKSADVMTAISVKTPIFPKL